MTDITITRWEKAPYCFIDGDLPELVEEALENELSYEHPGAEWTDAWKRGDWDGKISLLFTSTNDNRYFPVGLLPQAKRVFDVHSVPYRVKGLVRPGRGDLDVEWDTDKTLYPYQQDAVDDCLNAGSGLVVLPTGGGKTFIGIRLIYEYRQPTMVVCHLKEVADQWVGEIESILGVDVAKCYGGDRENGDVMVALYQSIYDDETKRVRDDVRLDHQLLLSDEAHRVAADTFSKVTYNHNAQYRFGFTATPDREDNATLRILGGTGQTIADLSAASLIDRGYLAEPSWKFYEPEHVGGRYQNWQAEYKQEIVENSRRNNLIAQVVGELERPTLVTVERINHGERLTSMIEGAKFVHGDAKDRDKNIEAFRNGGLDVMIATRGIVGEGFDVPDIASFVVAGGLKSRTSTIQQVGRAIRPGETGEATIVDFLDTGPHVGRHSEERIRAYREYYEDYGP